MTSHVAAITLPVDTEAVQPSRTLAPSWDLHAVYQPIVDLRTGEVVAAEALTRDSTNTRSITELFDDARSVGAERELDWQCRMTAVQTWLERNDDSRLTLFINAEPAALAGPEPQWWSAVADEMAERDLPLVVEITERQLAAHPAALLAFRDQVHARGWALALDDVGADPASLAFLPLLEPDVIKLDMQLLHRAPDLRTAQVVNAVQAHVSRTGALVLAEGIETEEHREFALSAGAVYGQGWLYGRPSARVPQPVGGRRRMVDSQLLRLDIAGDRREGPWDLLDSSAHPLRARKPLLSAISRFLELQARTADPSTIVLGCFQTRSHLGPQTLANFALLAATSSFVGVLGAGMPPQPALGVRGADLAPDDPLRDEWVVAVVSPHFAAALLAKDLHLPASSERQRQFDYVVTYDRALVVEVARRMVSRFDH